MSNTGKMALTLVLAAATAWFSVAGDRREKPPDPHTDFQAYTAYMLREHFPNVRLINQDKKRVRFYDDLIKGKIVVIQFMFSNCERLCPMVTPNLVKVQKELEKQSPRKVNIVSISVDPDHDTPAVLKAYAKKFHVQPGWQFLTGRRQDIDWLRRELGLYYPEDQQFEHMNMLTVGREATGQWFTIRALNNPEVIAYTVRKIIPDATSGRANPISAKHARSFAGN